MSTTQIQDIEQLRAINLLESASALQAITACNPAKYAIGLRRKANACREGAARAQAEGCIDLAMQLADMAESLIDSL